MRTASPARTYSVSRAATKAPARRSHKPVEPTKEEFLELKWIPAILHLRIRHLHRVP